MTETTEVYKIEIPLGTGGTAVLEIRLHKLGEPPSAFAYLTDDDYRARFMPTGEAANTLYSLAATWGIELDDTDWGALRSRVGIAGRANSAFIPSFWHDSFGRRLDELALTGEIEKTCLEDVNVA